VDGPLSGPNVLSMGPIMGEGVCPPPPPPTPLKTGGWRRDNGGGRGR
jgi:hypothetical protein